MLKLAEIERQAYYSGNGELASLADLALSVEEQEARNRLWVEWLEQVQAALMLGADVQDRCTPIVLRSKSAAAAGIEDALSEATRARIDAVDLLQKLIEELS